MSVSHFHGMAPRSPTPPVQGPGTLGAWVLRVWLLAVLAGVLPLLRLRLSAGHRRRLARGEDLPPDLLAAFAPDPPVHVPAIALGLVRDWVIPCFPNLVMRPAPVLCLRPRLPRPARAPPASGPPHVRTREIPRKMRALHHAHFVTIS